MRTFLATLGLASLLLSGTTTIAQAQSDPASMVGLGHAGNFAILTETGITNVPESDVRGNVGTSPITGAADHLTCPEVRGHIYSVDATGPQPCSRVRPHKLSIAVGDMETAYTTAAGRPAHHINIGGGDIGGLTLKPGVYRWDTDVRVSTNAWLKGDSRGVWIFQVSKNLIVAAAKHIRLRGEAQPQRIFWQIAGHVSLGANSHIEGVILCKTAINLKTGASVHGRLLAQTAATLEMNTVHAP